MFYATNSTEPRSDFFFAPVASANFAMMSDFVPRDFHDDDAWHIKATRVDKAWERLQKKGIAPGQSILIAHPDSGYAKHPALPLAKEGEGGVVLDKSFDFVIDVDSGRDDFRTGDGMLSTPGHGVQAASLMISPNVRGRNSHAVIGVAPSANVLPLKTSHRVFVTHQDALATAIRFAVAQGASVIAMAQGTPFTNANLLRSIEYADSQGVIVIAAAGNVVPFVVYPAAYPTVIAVAATNSDDEPSWVTSYGKEIDVALPGERIPIAWVRREPMSNEVYQDVRPGFGTTLATGQLAGIAALWLSYHGKDALREKYKERLPHVFRELVKRTARTPEGWQSDDYGSGIVDKTHLERSATDTFFEGLNLLVFE